MIKRSPAGLRLFAAVELPAALTARLGEVADQLERNLPRRAVRWARPEGIHLTLQFYGEVAASQVAGLQAALTQAAQVTGRLRLEARGLGAFPDFGRARVVWVGVGGEVEALGRLQVALQAACEPLGFAPEARAFSPHLTLGRVSDELAPPERKQLAQVLRQTHIGLLGEFSAGELSLIRSQLGPGGSVYTRLFAARLGGSEAAPPGA